LNKLLTLLILSFSCFAAAQSHKTYEQTIPGSTVRFQMAAIPGGTFKIGNNGGEPDERPLMPVTISPFWMGEHEVTFEEWDVFFKDIDVPQAKAVQVDAVSRPTPQYIDLTWGMGRDLKNPTNSMSQTAGIMYCKWLYNKTGFFYRLPTEAEWEYACRTGSSTAYPKGVDAAMIKDVAYFKANSSGKFQKVMQKKPNLWGLYDMLGNVSEWTLDQYDAEAYEKLDENAKDPSTPPASKYPRVARGGSYLDDASAINCSNRIPSKPEWNQRDPQIPKSRWWLTDGMFMGFRIVRPVQQPSKEEIESFYARYLK
jgi:formylglycine-generating enzyme required for sulfatase activity